MGKYPKAILLDSNPDVPLLRSQLGRVAEVICVDTIPEALIRAQAGDYDVLLCPWEPAGGTWRCVLKEIRDRHMEIPVVVFHHCGGEQEWAEVLGGGAFDLLSPPYDGDRLSALLEHAMASRHGMTERSPAERSSG